MRSACLVLLSLHGCACVTISTTPRFKAVDFASILEQRTTTEMVYAGVPLGLTPATRRGKVLTALARSCDAARYPDADIEDAAVGRRANGDRRPQHQSPYDWQRDGRRVACRSAQVRWDSNGNRWQAIFQKVRPESFDELHLALYSTSGVHLYRHDTRLGLSRNGKYTAVLGSHVKLYAPQGETDPAAALDILVTKLDASDCVRIAHVPFDDARFQAARVAFPPTATETAYSDVLLSDCSGPARGLRLAAMARRIDQELYPTAAVADPAIQGNRTTAGRQLGSNSVPYSWLRDETRVLCKASQLQCVTARRCWEVRYTGVRPGEYDELYLLLYTPRRAYLYRHDARLGVSTIGRATGVRGQDIQIRSAQVTKGESEADWEGALTHILGKLDGAGCKCLAVVDFET